MAAVLDLTRHAARIAQLDAARRQARWWRYGRYALIAAVVAWSVEAIVVGDTDWTRISWDGVRKAALRFIDFDASVLKEMWEPALETVLMATLATLLGALMAIPVAWLGANNISPLGRATYLVGAC
jgi:phosphonate transport system permease protein